MSSDWEDWKSPVGSRAAERNSSARLGRKAGILSMSAGEQDGRRSRMHRVNEIFADKDIWCITTKCN